VNPATVRDRLYVRAVVVDNGATRAALISADQIAVGEETWATAVREIASELDAPVENIIIIAATHTHSNGGPSSFMRSPLLPAALTEAVRLARDRMSPTLVGYGGGSA
jgi:hypothetical protein